MNGELKATAAQRQAATGLCELSDQKAALACMASFGTEDFRADLAGVTVPTLVIRGDGVAEFHGSGARTHAAIAHSKLKVLVGAPQGATSVTTKSSTWPLPDFLNSAAHDVGRS